MRTKTVTVREYDPQWVSDFEAIAGELRCILAEHTLAIHHVGRTSVPGMAAKPIIDLDVVIADYSVFPAVLEKLKSIGYFHEGDLGIPNREAFCYDGKFHLRKHHLYVCPADSPAGSFFSSPPHMVSSRIRPNISTAVRINIGSGERRLRRRLLFSKCPWAIISAPFLQNMAYHSRNL